MVSIHRVWGVAVLALMAAAAGCQPTYRPGELAELNQTPILIDEAMELRDWDRTVAFYENGGIVARPTGMPYELRDDVPDRQAVFAAPAMSVGQTIIMPGYMLYDRQWEERTFYDLRYPPTHHAQPPVE